MITSSSTKVPGQNTMSLTDDTFESTIHSDVYAIVLFHGGSPRDERALRVFDALSKSADSTRIVVAAMDLRTERIHAKRLGITGFPIVLFFYKDGTVSVPNVSLDSSSLSRFISEQTGYPFKLKTSNSQLSLRLTSSSFESAVLDKDKFVLVCFCADSKACAEFEERMYDQVTRTFRSEKDVLIASFDVSDSRTIARNCGVQFSNQVRIVLRWFSDGNDKAARHYQGELESNAIVSFVNRERASSHNRKLGGTLSSDAGRNVDADRLAQDMIRALARGYDTNLTDMKIFPLYHSIARKVISVGVSYVDTETKRLDRLLSQTDRYSARKRDFISRRRNILNAFVFNDDDSEL